MKKRGRPRLEERPIRIGLTMWLHRQEDDDLIEFYQRIKPGARVAATKAAMRGGGGLGAVQVEEDDGGGLDDMVDMLVF